MADNELLVTISGAALSLLFYENVRDVGDRMGFFLGEVLTYVTKKVTDDTDQEVESTRIHVDIKGVLPCPSTGLMYDNIGRVNTTRLHNFIGGKKREIVGWYRFRLNSSLTPTFRDKILLKQFESIFSSGSKIPTFVTCILNYSTTNIGGIHKFRHVFLRYKNGLYWPIPLQVNNLGSDASISKGSDYKVPPIRHNKLTGSRFFELLKEKLNSLSGCQAIIEIQKMAEEYLNDLVPMICKSDYEVALLEMKVMQLRSLIREELELRAIKNKNVQNNENFVSGEPHHGIMKNANAQHNKISLNEECTTTRTEKEYSSRKSEIHGNKNTCGKSNDKETILQGSKTYSDAMEKTNINTT